MAPTFGNGKICYIEMPATRLPSVRTAGVRKMSGPIQNDEPKARKTETDFVPCRTLQNVATSSTGGDNRCSHRQAPVRQAGGPYSARSARAPGLIREQGGGALQLSTSDHVLSTDQRCAAQTCYQTAAASATMLQAVLIQLFASLY
jgi:hypothetical protein